ncbi:MAG: single-stranded DNA-binding protein [Bacteroidaceae bacterium]|nr:single-stranded DNA-binding protein [Bacteroidaceae bacterium]
MSKSKNLGLLTGNVGNDPKVTPLENGIKVATFSLATSTGGYTSKEGKEIPEVTQWHNIVAWRGLAELCEKFIHKGDKIEIIGTIQYREYEKDGQKRYVTDIVASDIILSGGKSESNRPPMPTADNMPTPEMMPNIPQNDGLPF